MTRTIKKTARAKRSKKASTAKTKPARSKKTSAEKPKPARRKKARTSTTPARPSAASSRAAAPRKPRTKRDVPADDAALREAVRSSCLKQFERRLGRPWDEGLERLVQSDAGRLREQQEAFEVHENLRSAIEKAVEFVHRPREHAAPLGMGYWVPRFIQPLTEQDFLRKREVPAHAQRGIAVRNERHRLVAASNAADLIGAGRPLDATEFAIVWLLGGGWPEELAPEESDLTPARVIQAETQTFRALLRAAAKKAPRPTYRARFAQDDAGHWTATVQLDAERTAVAEGKTLEEAHQRLKETIALLPDDTDDAIGVTRVKARKRASGVKRRARSAKR